MHGGSRAKLVDKHLARQARALGDETRQAIFTFVSNAPEPVGVARITEEFQLNHNAIRQHLTKLRDAGLIIEETAPARGRGRPALRYRVRPGAVDQWQASSPYEELSLMLVHIVQGDEPEAVGFKTGRELAEDYYRRDGDDDPVRIVESVARRLGFEPQVSQSEIGTDLRLDRCPFAATAKIAPDVICTLHRGLADGAASVCDGVEVEGLTIMNPEHGGCILHLRSVEDTAVELPVADG